MTTDQILHSMIGGGSGGVKVASGVNNAAYLYIIVEAGVTFTVLEDNAAVDQMTAKGITEFAFTAERILGAGEGKTFKKLTFSGGNVWGYTAPSSSI